MAKFQGQGLSNEKKANLHFESKGNPEVDVKLIAASISHADPKLGGVSTSKE